MFVHEIKFKVAGVTYENDEGKDIQAEIKRIVNDYKRAGEIDEEDLYTQSKGIGFKDGRLNGYDWINSKEPPIGLSPNGRANSKYTARKYNIFKNH